MNMFIFQQAFSICCWHNEDSKERRHSFTLIDEELDKMTFLKVLTRTMANNACTADAVSLGKQLCLF